MIRTKVSICATAVLGLAALAWFLPGIEVWAGDGPADRFGRPLGVALLGGAMIAVGLVFRWATKEAKTPPTPRRRISSEFRRGFGERLQPRLRSVSPRPPTPPGVIALRQAIITEASKPRAPLGETLPATDIKRLQQLLQSRVAQLGVRPTVPAHPPASRGVIERQDRPRR